MKERFWSLLIKCASVKVIFGVITPTILLIVGKLPAEYYVAALALVIGVREYFKTKDAE